MKIEAILLGVIAGSLFAIAVALIVRRVIPTLYEARATFDRELISQLTRRRWSLVCEQITTPPKDGWGWVVIDAYSGIDLAADRRWEIAIQKALEGRGVTGHGPL